MLRHKAYKYRIYPSQEQMDLINQTIGSCRFVFNYFLAKWKDTYEQTGKGLSYNTCSSELPALKKTFEWLKSVDSIAVQTSVRHLADAYDRFFKKQNDQPRFKSKRNKAQSYTTKYTNGNIEMADNLLKLPK
ncbi:MAG TPA: helix-turn-helix domain-containing protein, partial [Bacillota bacterium]|nr:helix-turn-helix domain-containing protein [Bacillota bacterium]